MKRIYIDFDSTLYDTNKIRFAFKDGLSSEICKFQKDAIKAEIEDEIQAFIDKNFVKDYYELCVELEKKYNLQHNQLKRVIDNILANGEKNLYDDSIEFLKSLELKGYEINILTYTKKFGYNYQVTKILGSKILPFIDNLIICTRSKEGLKLDYENGVFIDDSPACLEGLYSVGVKGNRLVRMRRVGAGYSNLEVKINKKEYVEIASFNEIDFL